jgi:transcriptional regulator with XRE-family HTH domain
MAVISVKQRGIIEEMSKLSDYLNTEIEDRGWSKRELARRADVSSTQVTDVMNDRTNAGADFCVAVARALGEPPEDILRLAGILPPLPPAVQEEREIVRLVRSIGDQTRQTVMTMLRALAGVRQPVDASTVEPREPYQAENPQPRTLSEHLAWHIARDAQYLSEEEQGKLFDLMERIRGPAEENAGEALETH